MDIVSIVHHGQVATVLDASVLFQAVTDSMAEGKDGKEVCKQAALA